MEEYGCWTTDWKRWKPGHFGVCESYEGAENKRAEWLKKGIDARVGTRAEWENERVEMAIDRKDGVHRA